MTISTRVLITVLLLAVVGALWWLSSAPSEQAAPNAQSEKRNALHRVVIETTMGQIQFVTFDADAPKNVAHIIDLVARGFYDGLTFHRIIKDFMIQGGDPKGDGTGGPGYTVEDEIDPASEAMKEGYRRGIVAMANAGPNTNGSQFFIMHKNTPLPPNYTIIGSVASGMDAVDAIAQVKTDRSDRPLEIVKILRMKVERNVP